MGDMDDRGIREIRKLQGIRELKENTYRVGETAPDKWRSITYIYFRAVFGGTALCEQYVPEKPPVSVEQLIHDASLYIKLTGFMYETPRPSMPDVVSMGHLIARPGKPLQGDIRQIMETSKKGIF